MEKRVVHPYIPNSVPEVRDEMLREIGVKDVEEIYDVIPERLRLKRPMDLPKPILAEHDLKKHMERILSVNVTCDEALCFLGGGCWPHHVPAVCDEIAGRAEFLTAYVGEGYSDLGKYHAFFEFQSQMGELLEMDVVSLPTYDWASAAGNSIRMASRMTGRYEVLLPKTTSPGRLSVIRNFCQPEQMANHIKIRLLDYDPETGHLDLEDLKRKISSKTAAVYMENPSYLGFIEPQGEEISAIAHDVGAESIVGVDPISLGVLTPPAEYGADIACGDGQPLGIHMQYGGSLSGFIASRDEERYVSEYPSLLISITNTEREGEWGFGECRYDRTSYESRENAKDWVGTASCLWAIAGSVYMALMGPQGMRDIGETIIQRSRYAMKLLSEIDGISIPFSPNFGEFVASFDGTGKSVAEVNRALLDYNIFGGKDITAEFPKLGSSALYCVTEVHSWEDIEKLAGALREVVA